MERFFLLLVLLIASLNSYCQLIKGAERLDIYLPLLENKNVALLCNQASTVNSTNLVDTLLKSKINIVKIFTPEHGFNLSLGAGEKSDKLLFYHDSIMIISLYGKNLAPTKQQLSDIDIIVFDLQDVGCRFYTYISTLEYLMKIVSDLNIPLIVLDRPNPNNYVAGPVLRKECQSFVGRQNIPICYGLTIAEYALMLNGEKLINSNNKCKLTIIPMLNYQRDSVYQLDYFPSPNLPSMQAIINYPSLCLFEGTPISVGRGTDYPFEIIGFPQYNDTAFSFTPIAIKGKCENPPYKNKLCYGVKIKLDKGQLDLSYLLQMYKQYKDKEKFFLPMFDLLSGQKELKRQIQQDWTIEHIEKSWQKDIDAYLLIRNKYLIY